MDLPPTLDDPQYMRDLREARRDVESATVTPPPPLPKPLKAAPRRQRTHTFLLNHTDELGKTWSGEFTNRILTVAQKLQVGTVRARMQAGVPPEVFAAETWNLLYCLTWMEESLTHKPKWAENLGELTDEGVVFAVWQHVREHEDTFRQPAKPDQSGEVEQRVG